MNNKQFRSFLNDSSLTSKLISSTLDEWYKAKHRTSSIEEIELINNLSLTNCPRCDSQSVVRDGH